MKGGRGESGYLAGRKGAMIDNGTLCIHAIGRVNYTLEEAIETGALNKT